MRHNILKGVSIMKHNISQKVSIIRYNISHGVPNMRHYFTGSANETIFTGSANTLMQLHLMEQCTISPFLSHAR